MIVEPVLRFGAIEIGGRYGRARARTRLPLSLGNLGTFAACSISIRFIRERSVTDSFDFHILPINAIAKLGKKATVSSDGRTIRLEVSHVSIDEVSHRGVVKVARETSAVVENDYGYIFFDSLPTLSVQLVETRISISRHETSAEEYKNRLRRFVNRRGSRLSSARSPDWSVSVVGLQIPDRRRERRR